MTNEEIKKYMEMAIDEAKIGISSGHGGPFGAVIVKDNKVIAKSHNHVLVNKDPTAHGEITAIREACKNINNYDLTGSILFTTGEPCPMCLCACMWANIDKVYYGATIEDNEKIGFRDNKFDKMMADRNSLSNYLVCANRDETLKLFEQYNSINKIIY